jgi:hypothetical protein
LKNGSTELVMDIDGCCRISVLFNNKKDVGEYVYSRKFPNMVKEMILKASLYNNMFVSTK